MLANQVFYTPRMFTAEELASDLYQQLYAWQISESYDTDNLADLVQFTWSRGHIRMWRLCRTAIRWRTQQVPLTVS